MSIVLKYDQDNKLIIVTVLGKIMLDEIDSAFQQITRSSDYPPNIDALWDLRNTDFLHVDEKFIRGIIKLREKYSDRANNKSAIIVSDDLSFGLGRMFEMLAANDVHQEIMVFRDYSEGERWILHDRPAPC
ncbi:MAG: hypothetical protein V1782_10915 [Pseudomonadota bacterium]